MPQEVTLKKFHELSDKARKSAVAMCTNELLELIISDGVRFNDKLNGDDMQKRIDNAMAESLANHTPWFVHEYVMDAVGDRIKSMARCTAEDIMYVMDDTQFARVLPVGTVIRT